MIFFMIFPLRYCIKITFLKSNQTDRRPISKERITRYLLFFLHLKKETKFDVLVPPVIRFVHEAPLHAGGKASPPPSTQPWCGDLLQDPFMSLLDDLLCFVPVALKNTFLQLKSKKRKLFIFIKVKTQRNCILSKPKMRRQKSQDKTEKHFT